MANCKSLATNLLALTLAVFLHKGSTTCDRDAAGPPLRLPFQNTGEAIKLVLFCVRNRQGYMNTNLSRPLAVLLSLAPIASLNAQTPPSNTVWLYTLVNG